MNKFNILKSSFHHKMAKIRQIKSGSGGDYTPKWKMFDSLSFLADTVTQQGSTSNLDVTVPSVSTCSRMQHPWRHWAPFVRVAQLVHMD
ncbi:hypothetical protein E2C01_075331 [Portunus trituberculatus]|uniref:MADF domain-containing protein n=1 Tax=Portunus trituberculatus TaxID=210409 RepID=A0A5B7IEQ2_PORTR|nr:hypothetical protein [Portunus trituberculatus]